MVARPGGLYRGNVQRLAMLVLVVGSVARAAPTRPDAKAEFDRGLAAYSAGNYASAADALAKSYSLEPDPETLFAWAQSERKHGHCEKAIELYTKMLEFELGEENRREVNQHIDECKATLPKTAPPPPPPPRVVQPTVVRRPWWQDPVGGVLVGAGVVGGVVGTVFLFQARDARDARDAATTYPEYKALHDRAVSRGQLGAITTVGAGALVVGGILWYALRTQPTTTMTAWLNGTGGGVGVAGSF